MPDEIKEAIKSIDKVWQEMWSVGFNTAVFGPIEAVEQFEKSMVKCTELCLILIGARKAGMDTDELLAMTKEIVEKLSTHISHPSGAHEKGTVQ